MSRPRPAIPRLAAYTWALQWPSVLLTGLTLGILSLAPFAVKRSLGAGEAVVPLLVACWQVIWVFAPAVGPLLARQHPQRLWRRMGVIAHAPLFLIALVVVTPVGAEGRGEGTLWLFFVAMLLHYAMGIANVPHRGAMIRTNYAPSVRGRMYAWMQLVTILGTILAAKGCAWLLDHDPRWLRVLFPLAGVLGLTSFLLLARIRWRRQRRLLLRPHVHEGVVAAWTAAWRETARILREDRDFRMYEIGFMTYGFGFLASVPLLVLYAEERLALSYGQYTWATAVAFPIAQIAAMAMWGRLADRWGVVRTTSVAFLALSVFFLSMTLVSSPLGLVAAYVLWGLAMSGVDVGWSLGPLHFAPDEQAHMYTAVHFCMVGIRSVIAPFLGFFVKSQLGFAPAFAMSGGLLVAASVVVARIGRRRVS